MSIPLRYDDATDFVNGFARVQAAGKWGIITKTGSYHISPLYEDICLPSENTVAVRQAGKWGLLDGLGLPVSGGFRYETPPILSNGLAAVRFEGKWGYINARGQWVVEPQFDYATNFQNGLAQVRLGGKVGYIKPDGSFLWPLTE
jgi:hypothetical protein